MRVKDAETITLKKLKKDGSIDIRTIERVAETIMDKKMVLLPVDNIYGLAGFAEDAIAQRIADSVPSCLGNLIILISSFKMLEEISTISKLDYDFLHRIWPGEVNVILNNVSALSGNNKIAVRYPKSKFLLKVIDTIEHPLIMGKACVNKDVVLYREKEILSSFQNAADLILIVQELCKKHPLSTLIDITSSDIQIIREGKVSIDEIKSLYFLGKDDDIDY